jgi:hypothetical protein
MFLIAVNCQHLYCGYSLRVVISYIYIMQWVSMTYTLTLTCSRQASRDDLRLDTKEIFYAGQNHPDCQPHNEA